jgi:hypothetical protein
MYASTGTDTSACRDPPVLAVKAAQSIGKTGTTIGQPHVFSDLLCYPFERIGSNNRRIRAREDECRSRSVYRGVLQVYIQRKKAESDKRAEQV